jgi:hypothetical protein
MSSIKTQISTRRTVAAITQEENKLRAIGLREKGGFYKILWVRSKDGSANWRLFAAECGLSTEPAAQISTDGNKGVIIGYNSAGVAFYRLNVPAVGREETAEIVKLQAETRLPLSADQMELAWRTDQAKNGQVGVTLAAARKETLKRFVENVQAIGPAKILLDSEGIIKTWRTFFAGTEKTAVVLSMTARNTQVCLAENAQLSNAVVLDIGIDDFAVTDEAEQTSERFVQDMISVLGLFGYAEQMDLPIFLLSDGNAIYEGIVYSLKAAGLNAQVAQPDIKEMKIPDGIGVEGIYEYRAAIGLGLMALDGSREELNIFEQLYSPAAKKEKKHWLLSPKAACIIAGAMLALSVFVSYAIDVAKPGALEKRLSASGSDIGINQLMQRQKLIKAVAQQRPDLLNLLGQINASDDLGIKLESFHFKKGQPVTITGQAPGNEQLYKFHKSLEDRSSIKNVKTNPSQDSKTKKLTFTMTFHYKNFTK